ncbi:MAG: hypothetical protein HYY05_06140 [Chloroflexi bacterium]|nr:hypothetical protein [Chloroflexota bacterium]
MSRDKLHRLVDELPPREVPAAERVLEHLRNVGLDPVLRAFMAAPVDDEPLTESERAAIRESEDEIGQGQGSAWEEVRTSLRRSREQAG